jgi:hypothetical protein
MRQAALFHDSIFDALGADISAIGGFKKVSAYLWPALDSTVSTTRLRSALNPEHAQKLCPSEVLEIKRLSHTYASHATVEYEALQLSFKVEWISPENARADMQRQFVDGVKQLEQLAKRLQR